MTPEQIKKDQEAELVQFISELTYQDATRRDLLSYNKGVQDSVNRVKRYFKANPIQQVSKSDEERADEALEKQFDGTGFLEKPYSRYRYHNGYLAGMLDERAIQNKCEAGCQHFYGGEIAHHKDCVFYPDSRSEMYDNLKAQLAKQENAVSGLVEALKDLRTYSYCSETCRSQTSWAAKCSCGSEKANSRAREALKAFKESRSK